jgi:hypothetical protein
LVYLTYQTQSPLGIRALTSTFPYETESDLSSLIFAD